MNGPLSGYRIVDLTHRRARPLRDPDPRRHGGGRRQGRAARRRHAARDRAAEEPRHGAHPPRPREQQAQRRPRPQAPAGARRADAARFRRRRLRAQHAAGGHLASRAHLRRAEGVSARISCTAAPAGFGSGGPYAGRPAYDDLIQGMCGIADLMGTGHGRSAPLPRRPSSPTRPSGSSSPTRCSRPCSIASAPGKARRSRSPCSRPWSPMSWSSISGSVPCTRTTERSATCGCSRRTGAPSAPAMATCACSPTPTATGRRSSSLPGAPSGARIRASRTSPAGPSTSPSCMRWPKRCSGSGTTAEWLADLEKAEIPAGPVNALEDLLADPQPRWPGPHSARRPSERGRDPADRPAGPFLALARGGSPAGPPPRGAHRRGAARGGPRRGRDRRPPPGRRRPPVLISHCPSAAMFHRFPAAAANLLAVSGRTPSRRFDVVSATPSASLSPCGPLRQAS